jgi:hypothetical protein
MSPSVYVYSPERLSRAGGSLIQGLAALGIKVTGNVDLSAGEPHGVGAFSPRSAASYAVAPHDNSEDILVFCETRPISSLKTSSDPHYLALKHLVGQKPVAVLNMEDDVNLTDYPEGIRVYTAHTNAFAPRHGDIHPMGFGITDEILCAADSILGENLPRTHRYIHNFNPSFNQSVREAMDFMLVSAMRSRFPIDDRHLGHTEYVHQLATSSAILAYGGAFVSNILAHPYFREIKEQQGESSHLGRYAFKGFTGNSAILRWDSYRFWEACVFACAPLQFEFEKCGFVLPVMPQPWVHYVPIDPHAVSLLPSELERRGVEDPDFLVKIGANARAWSLEHYSPKAFAKRILSEAMLP